MRLEFSKQAFFIRVAIFLIETQYSYILSRYAYSCVNQKDASPTNINKMFLGQNYTTTYIFRFPKYSRTEQLI